MINIFNNNNGFGKKNNTPHLHNEEGLTVINQSNFVKLLTNCPAPWKPLTYPNEIHKICDVMNKFNFTYLIIKLKLIHKKYFNLIRNQDFCEQM